MHIRNIIIRNFRRYGDAAFCFNEKFNVLVGNNGKGNTTILDALAIMLNTYFQASGIPTGVGGIKNADARFVITEKDGQVFREPNTDVWLKASAHAKGQIWEWQRNKGDRGGNAKEFIRLGAETRSTVTRGENPTCPLLLYYGAGRLWNIHRNVETTQPDSQLDAYRYCLDPKSDQNAFERWFKKLTFSSLQRKIPIPALEAVSDAVLCCTPGASTFYHDIAEDQIMIQLDHEGLMPFNSLSDGFRNMVAMVADMAHRACRLNPHLSKAAAKETPGVVLIDEIDLHLHPKWQRRVVADLQKAFPKLQFIATTHSPFIIQSLKPGQLIDLEQEFTPEQINSIQPGIAAPGPGHDFSNRSIEDIIEGVMQVPVPQRSERYQQMHDVAKEYYAILKQSTTADTHEKARLKRRLDELSAPFSDNPAYSAFLEMERTAAGMGNGQCDQ